MPATYENLSTTTLSSATNSVTFSSISGSYTDLILVYSGTFSATDNLLLQVNGNTNSIYSVTLLRGTGTAAQSASVRNDIHYNTASNQGTTVSDAYFNIFNYANTTRNKTILSRTNVSDNRLLLGAGIIATTSAITSVRLYLAVANFSIGSTFTLYGIKAA